MAGSAATAKDRVPKRSRSANQASTAPGTVIGSGPERGIVAPGP